MPSTPLTYASFNDLKVLVDVSDTKHAPSKTALGAQLGPNPAEIKARMQGEREDQELKAEIDVI